MIPLSGGTPSDVVLDELRHRLYLIYNNTSRVNIFDYTTNVVTGSIPVGKSPVAGALSMDGNWLYVTSGATPTQTASGTPLLNVIDLSQERVVQSVVLPSIPQGVEVGQRWPRAGQHAGQRRGRRRSRKTRWRSSTGPSPPASSSPGERARAPYHSRAAARPRLSTRPTKIFTGSLLRTPDGQFIVGVIPPTNASTYIFVYEVASGVVLRNRTVSGSSRFSRWRPTGRASWPA